MDRFQESECSLQFENYKNTICGNFTGYFNRKCFLDVTLICDGDAVMAHQIVLSSCSQFFEDILIARPEPHPILVFTEIPKNHMELLLKFMYNGRVKVPKELLFSFLKTAKKLDIRGLNYDDLNFAQAHSQEEVKVNVTQNASPAVIEKLHQNGTVRENTNVEQNLVTKEEPRWLTSGSGPVKEQECGKKVLNPFAVKSRSFTDSDSTTYDLSIPGPSKRSPKKNTSRAILSSTKNDSDVEFIDKTCSVVVIPDTQLSDSSDMQSKVHSKVRKRIVPAKASDLLNETNFTSDESDIVASRPKKPRKNAVVDESEDESDATPPDLITSAALKTNENGNSNPSAKIQNKNRIELNKSGTELIVNGVCAIKWSLGNREPFEGYSATAVKNMYNFCHLCGKNLRCIKKHIEKCHKLQFKETFRCTTCSQVFFNRTMLELHCAAVHRKKK